LFSLRSGYTLLTLRTGRTSGTGITFVPFITFRAYRYLLVSATAFVFEFIERHIKIL
jgi:hypothetical protein